MAINKYLCALENDSSVSNIKRVMIVGHFGVGKTTIAMQPLEKKGLRIRSTDGIDVYINQCIYDKVSRKWHTKVTKFDNIPGFDGFIRIDLVDFAGQLIFYTTHQTYLTSRGLYLLVFNLAMGLEAEVDDEDLHPGKNRRTVIDFLEFWISTIVTYARGEQVSFPKIILIGTHKDKIEDKTELDRTKRKIEDTFQQMVQTEQLVVRDDLFISAKDMSDASRQNIRDIILEEGMKYKEFGERIPASWNVLQETLMNIKGKNNYVISKDVIKKINSEAQSPLDEEELEIFLKYLHNIGYILYFSTSVLNEKIVLDPKVVILAIRSIITCERFVTNRSLERVWRNMRETGQVKKSHILKMWEEKGIVKHSQHFLAIMKKLDLICEPMIYKGGQRLSLDVYVVPSMIEAETPKEPLVQVQHAKSAQLVFSSKTLLPPAIFNRLVCSCLVCWPIYKNHFYNGLVVLKIGRFHIMEMRRQVYNMLVTIAQTSTERNLDGQLCFAIKEFLEETLDQIVAVYSAFDKPITMDSSSSD